MASRPGSRPSTDRRSFLAATGATLAGGVLATGTASAVESAPYHLSQGDQCVPLQPLRGDDPVEAFYDYRRDRDSSYGTRSLQQPNTSVLFLYEGSDGVSLVVVHGALGGNGDGGSITFELSGLPSSGDWVVRDDSYDGPNRYDRWDIDGSSATVDWTWDGRRADGAVYGPLGDDVSIGIDPAFNERAALYGDHYEGKVSNWQALSGDLDDPTRTSLDRSTPVRIESGSCPTAATAATRTTGETTTAGSTSGESTTAAGTETTGSESSGNGDELQRFLDGLSRLFDWLSRLFGRLSRLVERYL
ncbi:hypothetical protein [Halococcus hamelinensis]|uniref:Cell surface glycoprotein related protein n=1 Tax=Halococcus hamelinensis 100A6 TaxID=1132509 RepID=M0LRH4_9EURY|nr:hypothetical protein [Halococcus hamelinensis]EMA35698.1 hypothetical protein C447_16109 [Halococcus hamelinensis 100A6]